MNGETRVHVGRLVLGAVLLLVGAAWLLLTLGLVDVPIQSALAAALILVGVVLLFVGRHGGLVALGVTLTVVLAFLALLDVPFEGGIGERAFRPASVADLRTEYRMAVGKMTLDLGDLSDAGAIPDIEATLGVGELIVLLPEGAAVRVEGEAGAGEVVLLGRSQAGLGVAHSVTETSPDFELDVSVGLGKVEVRR